MTEGELTRELNLHLIKTRMAFRQAVQRMLRIHRVEMTFEMLQIIQSLRECQGVSQRCLADKTAKDKASLTNLINNLERKGWVERRKDDADHRHRLIYLTEEGMSMSDRAMPLLRRIYDQAGAVVPRNELEICTNYLKKLNAVFDEI